MKRIFLLLGFFLCFVSHQVSALEAEVSGEADLSGVVQAEEMIPTTMNAADTIEPIAADEDARKRGVPSDVSETSAPSEAIETMATSDTPSSMTGSDLPEATVTSDTPDSANMEKPTMSDSTFSAPTAEMPLPEKIVPKEISVRTSQSGVTSTCNINGKAVDCAEFGNQVESVVKTGLGIFAVMAIIGLILTIFWIVMLVHVFSNAIPNKLLWIFVIIFVPFGAIIYYFVIKRNFTPGVYAPPGYQTSQNPPVTSYTPAPVPTPESIQPSFTLSEAALPPTPAPLIAQAPVVSEASIPDPVVPAPVVPMSPAPIAVAPAPETPMPVAPAPAVSPPVAPVADPLAMASPIASTPAPTPSPEPATPAPMPPTQPPTA